MINIDFKMKNVHVPYKGCGPAVVDVMGGQVDFAVITISAALSSIAANKLRALAITSKDRSKTVPNVPAIAESGSPSFNSNQWQGLAVPAGTPENVKQDIYKVVSSIMNSPEMRKRLEDLGYTVVDEDPKTFQKLINDDIDRYGALAKQVGLQSN